jgi:hypothetical protein
MHQLPAVSRLTNFKIESIQSAKPYSAQHIYSCLWYAGTSNVESIEKMKNISSIWYSEIVLCARSTFVSHNIG